MNLGHGDFSPSSSMLTNKTPPQTCRSSLRHLDEQAAALRNENFKLKLRIYFMEQQRLPPVHVDGGANGSPSATREDHQITSMCVDNEMLRAELGEKQSLLCEAAVGMQQLDDLLQSERQRHEELAKQLRSDIEGLRSQNADLLLVSAQQTSESNAVAEMRHRLIETEAEIQSQKINIEWMKEKHAERLVANGELAKRYDELQRAHRRALYEIENLKEELANKTTANNELEMFRIYSKKNYSLKLERMCRENRILHNELAELRSNAQRLGRTYDSKSGSSDENVRIIAEQSRMLRELNKSMDCRTKAMNEIRSELELHQREVHQLRIRNSDLTERIRSQRCEQCLIMRQPQVAIKFPIPLETKTAIDKHNMCSTVMSTSSEKLSSSLPLPIGTDCIHQLTSSGRFNLLPNLALTAISMPPATKIAASAMMAKTKANEQTNSNTTELLDGHVANKSEAMPATSISALYAGKVLLHDTEEQRPSATSTSLVGNGLRLLFDRMRS